MVVDGGFDAMQLFDEKVFVIGCNGAVGGDLNGQVEVLIFLKIIVQDRAAQYSPIQEFGKLHFKLSRVQPPFDIR